MLVNILGLLFCEGYSIAQLVEPLGYEMDVVVSIPDEVIWIFQLLFGRPMALGSTQPVTENSTMGITRGVKAVDA